VLNGSAASINAPTTNLTGTLSATGTIGNVRLNYVAGSNLVIGAGSGSTTLTFGRVLDTSISSAIPIKLLTAAAYLNTDGVPDIVAAPSVNLNVRGDFQGTLNVGTLGVLKVGGSIDGATINATNAIGVVLARSIVDSTLFAGVKSGLTTLPSSSDDFVNKASHINAVIVGKGGFSNTLIAGWRVGALALGSVSTTAGGSEFGVSAGRVNAISAFADTSIRKVGLDKPAQGIFESNFLIRPL